MTRGEWALVVVAALIGLAGVLVLALGFAAYGIFGTTPGLGMLTLAVSLASLTVSRAALRGPR